jgi:hypothetical protein
MDGKILDLAERLQKSLRRLDETKDRDSLVWAHGFLKGMMNTIEDQLPDLMSSKTLLQKLTSMQEEFNVMQERHPDSLDDIERELGSDDAPIGVRTKPGPKGRSGGTAMPLPESDLPM